MRHVIRFASAIGVTAFLASPAAAEECKFDKAAADASFNQALDAIVAHQGFAWSCAPYIGDGLARSNSVSIEMLLRDSGFKPADAIVKAGELDAQAKKGAELHPVGSAGATRQEVIIACSQLMDEQYQKFRAARAEMIKAQCSQK
ncbi:hypothetical protein [Rhizobium phaseoli]|uniref:Uncharacterized protein n=1 Tax=Rhizobium phaseoli TaxID=396 RepID=A0ABN4QG74_9HYPH|nr:hypothetical protein [Rhizobium phaseoli]ANL84631.1 hypothetical protein AMC81_CH01850 [Rhizobium phaseoli]ANL91138.1 hypothetical protein AMC80_CH01850 [Rhizobium phaseoli]